MKRINVSLLVAVAGVILPQGVAVFVRGAVEDGEYVSPVMSGKVAVWQTGGVEGKIEVLDFKSRSKGEARVDLARLGEKEYVEGKLLELRRQLPGHQHEEAGVSLLAA